MAKKEVASVTMRVRIGENEFEVTGPSNYVEDKIAEFLERQKSIPVKGAEKSSLISTTPTTLKSSKEMSVAQFFKKVSPKSEIERVLASGYFLEKFKKEEKFTAAEISGIIRESKRQPPKNPNDAVNQNIKKGHMMSAGDKDGKMAFVLTSDGEEVIEESLNA